MSRRGLPAALCVGLLGVVLGTDPAAAGGSLFAPADDRYEPEQAATVVGYTGGGAGGWIEDGPYYAYLRVDPAAAEQYEAQVPGDSEQLEFPTPGDLRLGELLLQETGRGGWQSLRAAITFTVPAGLAPGAYTFRYCTDPCRHGLGDLIGTTIYVSVDPPRPIGRSWPAGDPAFQGAPASVSLPAPPPTTAALPTTTSVPVTHERTAPERPTVAATAPHEGEESTFLWLPIGAGALLVGVAAVALARRRRRRHGSRQSGALQAPPVLSDAAERSKEMVGAGPPRD